MAITVYHASHPTFGLFTSPGDTKFIPDDYVAVAKVDTDDMGEAFHLTNNIDRSWQNNNGITMLVQTWGTRSTSVGDVLALEDGTKFRIEAFGHTQLES